MSNKKANRRRVTRSVTIKPHLAAWLEARQCSLSRAVEQCVELVYLEHRGDVAQLEADGYDGDAISELRVHRPAPPTEYFDPCPVCPKTCTGHGPNSAESVKVAMRSIFREYLERQ